MSSDAKKTAVKEKFKARPGVGRILPEKHNELVPVANVTQTSIENLPKTTPRQETAATLSAKSQAPSPRNQDNTQLTQYGTFMHEREPTRIASDSPRRLAPKRRDKTPWLFLVPAFALVAFVWFDDASEHPTTRSPFSQTQRSDEDEYARRVDEHRKLTGWKMNRERADVEIQNHFSAPPIAYDAAKKKAPDMMAGLPLAGESHPRAQDAPKPRGISADYPDTRIQYGLREEQEARYVDQKIEQQFVDEFIENARREGYDLSVQQDGTVVIKRAPSQVPGSSD
jgi:hypothetical protein